MVTADVQIVGQGSVVVTPTRTEDGFTHYEIAATPAAGWAFVRFEWDLKTRIVPAGSGQEQEFSTHYTDTDNPCDDTWLFDGVKIIPDVETWYTTIENATAYFAQSHGQGIIYDPNQQNGIIYDLTTGLPMCYT